MAYEIRKLHNMFHRYPGHFLPTLSYLPRLATDEPNGARLHEHHYKPMQTLLVLTLILMDNSSVAAMAALSVNDKNRILSMASDAFEINSLRKICNGTKKHEMLN